jgi:TPR repeat protein
MVRNACERGSHTGCIEQARLMHSALRVEAETDRGSPGFRARRDTVLRTYETACRAKFFIACTNLGGIRHVGDLHTRADPAAARRIYEGACNGGRERPERGAGVACWFLAELMREQGEPESRVIARLREGCRLPSPEACTALARDSTRERRASIPAEEAVVLAGTACFQRYAEGCYVAGALAEATNRAAAREFHRRGCRLGDARSCARVPDGHPAVTRR